MSAKPPRCAPPLLVLGSRSPRRALLLREAGYRFDQADPPFQDPDQPNAGDDGPRLARELALAKARSLVPALAPRLGGRPAVVLGADTICLDPAGRLVGKPRDRDHARAMLRGFMGHTHRVISGVALVCTGGGPATTLDDAAEVWMAPVPDADLEAYLDAGQWRGKAGGYNLFDRQAAGWGLTVRGDPGAVVGLPMRKLLPALAALGVRPESAADASPRGVAR